MKEKNAWKEIYCSLGIVIVSAQTGYNTIRISFMKHARSA